MILDSFSLEGKKAVVTGCGTGIGQGMAIALADVGADIVGMGLLRTTKPRRRLKRNVSGVKAIRQAEKTRETM